MKRTSLSGKAAAYAAAFLLFRRIFSKTGTGATDDATIRTPPPL